MFTYDKMQTKKFVLLYSPAKKVNPGVDGHFP